MRFMLGLALAIIGLSLFFIGTQTAQILDPGMAAGGQRKGTYFFFGLLACLAGVFIIVTDFRKRDCE